MVNSVPSHRETGAPLARHARFVSRARACERKAPDTIDIYRRSKRRRFYPRFTIDTRHAVPLGTSQLRHVNNSQIHYLCRRYIYRQRRKKKIPSRSVLTTLQRDFGEARARIWASSYFSDVQRYRQSRGILTVNIDCLPAS